MDKNLKKKWITALRSGEYQQTRHMLRREEVNEDAYDESVPVGFCCLGVLCDIDNPEGWSDDGDWMGLSSEAPGREIAVVFDFDQRLGEELVVKNDMNKWNFFQIADWIEESDI